jgi:hypothetical protein
VFVPIAEHVSVSAHSDAMNIVERSLMRSEGGAQVSIDMHGNINKSTPTASAVTAAQSQASHATGNSNSSLPNPDSWPARIISADTNVDFEQHKEVAEMPATQPTTEQSTTSSTSEELVETTKATTTTTEPLLCNEYAGYKLCRVMQGFECKSSDINMTNQATLSDCAAKVYEDSGRFMVYGTGDKATACYKELPSADEAACFQYRDAASCCPELWEEDAFNFYIIIPVGVEEHRPNSSRRSSVHLFAWILSSLLAVAFPVIAG